jgi:hypothetical protein
MDGGAMSSPRVPTPLAGLKREVEIWAGLLFFCAGIAMLIIAADLAMTELRYAREAIIVPATVLERDFIPADRADNPTTRYRIRFRYAVEGAQPQERAEEVDVERWEALAPGGQFDLAVLPGEGARPRGSGLAEMIGVAVLVVICGIFVPLGWFLGVSRLKRALRLVRVYWRGAEARGEVLEVVETGTAINRLPMSRMRFRYIDLKGMAHEGETGLLSPAEAASLEPGAAGLVRYDMADPEISVWVDRGGEAN